MKSYKIFKIGNRDIMPYSYDFSHKGKRFTIKPGDILVIKNSIASLFDHKVIYPGIDYYSGEPVFMENHPDSKGIRWVSLKQLKKRYGNNVWEIEPFYGNFYEIVYRLKKYWGYLRNKKYDWFDWNCEHFVYFLREGKKRSPQLERVIKTAIVLGTIIVLSFLLNKSNR